MSKSSKNILVTGGAGYIGSHIVEQLIKNRQSVIILDNLVTGYKKLINKKAKFIKADIKNKSKMTKIIKDYNINSIIYFNNISLNAAVKIIPFSQFDLCMSALNPSPCLKIIFGFSFSITSI